ASWLASSLRRSRVVAIDRRPGIEWAVRNRDVEEDALVVVIGRRAVFPGGREPEIVLQRAEYLFPLNAVSSGCKSFNLRDQVDVGRLARRRQRKWVGFWTSGAAVLRCAVARGPARKGSATSDHG